MEATILKSESRVSEIETLLSDPSFFITRAHEAASLIAELDQMKKSVPVLYSRWEELGKMAEASAE